MHHSLALIFAIGLAGNYVVDAQEAPKTTEPPGLDAAFTEGSIDYKTWWEGLSVTGGELESIGSVASVLATGTASAAFAQWRSWERINRIATKDEEQIASERSSILSALPTEIQQFFSSKDRVYSSLKSEFQATWTPPARPTTRSPIYYLAQDENYQSYVSSLRANGIYESLESVADAATGKEGSAVSAWRHWRTVTVPNTELVEALTELPTAIQSFHQSYDSRISQLVSAFAATFSMPPFEPDPTTTPANYEFFLPSEPEYYLNHQSLVENGILASLSSIAATATGSEASAISRWSVLQAQLSTTTVDPSELTSAFHGLPTAIQEHIISDKSLRSKILATWTPTAGPWTQTYASPGPEGFSTFPTGVTTSPGSGTTSTGTASGATPSVTATGGVGRVGGSGSGSGIGLAVYGVVVGAVGVGAILL